MAFYNVTPPLGNVNSNFVNISNSHNPSNFGSNETSAKFGLHGVSNNIQAANSSILHGGKRIKTIRKKIKNIVNKYKTMPAKRKMTARRIKKRLSLTGKFSKSKKNNRKLRQTRRRGKNTRQRGGSYHQYMGNIPNTPSYETGGVLAANDLGLANPVPYKSLDNCVNCVDNYNHFTGKGFQFW